MSINVRESAVSTASQRERNLQRLEEHLDLHQNDIPRKQLLHELKLGGMKYTEGCCTTAFWDPKLMTLERVEYLLVRADTDYDNRISYEEILELLKSDDIKRSERAFFQKALSASAKYILCQDLENDYLANYKLWPPPLFVVTMCITQVVIFAVYAAELSKTDDPVTATTGVPLYSPLVYKPTRRYEAWRFVTYMFIHQGYFHLIGNLILQFMYGLTLELVHGPIIIMVLYLLGVVAGSLAHSVTDHTASLVGASGGAYALLGGHVAAVILNWDEMNFDWRSTLRVAGRGDGRGITRWEELKLLLVRLLQSAPVVLFLTAGFVLFDTSMAIYRRITADASHKIGVGAHIGGLTCGVLIGLRLLKNFQEHRWERTLAWVALGVYLTLMLFGFLFNGLYKGYPPTDWSS